MDVERVRESLNQGRDWLLWFASRNSGARINESLDRIRRAEEKLREGSYGYCDVCGCQIDETTLKAEVHAIMCMSCARRSLIDDDYQPPPICYRDTGGPGYLETVGKREILSNRPLRQDQVCQESPAAQMLLFRSQLHDRP